MRSAERFQTQIAVAWLRSSYPNDYEFYSKIIYVS